MTQYELLPWGLNFTSHAIHLSMKRADIEAARLQTRCLTVWHISVRSASSWEVEHRPTTPSQAHNCLCTPRGYGSDTVKLGCAAGVLFVIGTFSVLSPSVLDKYNPHGCGKDTYSWCAHLLTTPHEHQTQGHRTIRGEGGGVKPSYFAASRGPPRIWASPVLTGAEYSVDVNAVESFAHNTESPFQDLLRCQGGWCITLHFRIFPALQQHLRLPIICLHVAFGA